MRALSISRKKLLEILLSDPTILSKILMENELPKSIEINDDGSIIFGHTKYRWLNQIIGCFRQVSLLEVSINIADAITGSGPLRNSENFDCITKDLLNSAIKDKDLDRVVDILFDSMRAGTEGELASKFITKKDIERFSKDPNTKNRIKTGKLDVYGKVMLNSGLCIDVLLNDAIKLDTDVVFYQTTIKTQLYRGYTTLSFYY